MTAPTFVPPIDPSPGTGYKPEVTIMRADFGDGYTQASKRLNNVRRVLSLKWDVLTATQAATINSFLAARGGSDPFLYTPPGEATQVLFTCEDFGFEYIQAGYRSYSATFRQSFNLV